MFQGAIHATPSTEIERVRRHTLKGLGDLAVSEGALDGCDSTESRVSLLYHSAIDLTVATKGGDRLEKCHVVVLHLKVATTICGCEA